MFVFYTKSDLIALIFLICVSKRELSVWMSTKSHACDVVFCLDEFVIKMQNPVCRSNSLTKEIGVDILRICIFLVQRILYPLLGVSDVCLFVVNFPA